MYTYMYTDETKSFSLVFFNVQSLPNLRNLIIDSGPNKSENTLYNLPDFNTLNW